jgi:hypothetical protein
MNRKDVPAGHAIFGDGYRKLEDDDTLQAGDQTACASMLFTVEFREHWIDVVPDWNDVLGETIRAVCDDHGDIDGPDRLFRRKI